MPKWSHPSKAQMDTHLVLELIIAATSVITLSSSLAGLWVAKKAAGQAARKLEDATEDPVGKTTDTVGKTAGWAKKVGSRSDGGAATDDSDTGIDDEGAEDRFDEDESDWGDEGDS